MDHLKGHLWNDCYRIHEPYYSGALAGFPKETIEGNIPGSSHYYGPTNWGAGRLK